MTNFLFFGGIYDGRNESLGMYFEGGLCAEIIYYIFFCYYFDFVVITFGWLLWWRNGSLNMYFEGGLCAETILLIYTLYVFFSVVVLFVYVIVLILAGSTPDLPYLTCLS